MLSTHPLSFGARFIRSFPLEVEHDGQHQETVQGKLFKLNQSDAAEYKPVLSEWPLRNPASLANQAIWSLEMPVKGRKIYALKGEINGQERVLGYLFGSRDIKGYSIDCIEKAPGISGKFRVKNVLTAMIYGYLKDQKVTASKQLLIWEALTSASESYDRLFRRIIGRVARHISNGEVLRMYLNPNDIRDFEQQVETRFLKEA